MSNQEARLMVVLHLPYYYCLLRMCFFVSVCRLCYVLCYLVQQKQKKKHNNKSMKRIKKEREAAAEKQRQMEKKQSKKEKKSKRFQKYNSYHGSTAETEGSKWYSKKDKSPVSPLSYKRSDEDKPPLIHSASVPDTDIFRRNYKGVYSSTSSSDTADRKSLSPDVRQGNPLTSTRYVRKGGLYQKKSSIVESDDADMSSPVSSATSDLEEAKRRGSALSCDSSVQSRDSYSTLNMSDISRDSVDSDTTSGIVVCQTLSDASVSHDSYTMEHDDKGGSGDFMEVSSDDTLERLDSDSDSDPLSQTLKISVEQPDLQHALASVITTPAPDIRKDAENHVLDPVIDNSVLDPLVQNHIQNSVMNPRSRHAIHEHGLSGEILNALSVDLNGNFSDVANNPGDVFQCRSDLSHTQPQHDNVSTSATLAGEGLGAAANCTMGTIFSTDSVDLEQSPSLCLDSPVGPLYYNQRPSSEVMFFSASEMTQSHGADELDNHFSDLHAGRDVDSSHTKQCDDEGIFIPVHADNVRESQSDSDSHDYVLSPTLTDEQDNVFMDSTITITPVPKQVPEQRRIPGFLWGRPSLSPMTAQLLNVISEEAVHMASKVEMADLVIPPPVEFSCTDVTLTDIPPDNSEPPSEMIHDPILNLPLSSSDTTTLQNLPDHHITNLTTHSNTNGNDRKPININGESCELETISGEATSPDKTIHQKNCTIYLQPVQCKRCDSPKESSQQISLKKDTDELLLGGPPLTSDVTKQTVGDSMCPVSSESEVLDRRKAAPLLAVKRGNVAARYVERLSSSLIVSRKADIADILPNKANIFFGRTVSQKTEKLNDNISGRTGFNSGALSPKPYNDSYSSSSVIYPKTATSERKESVSKSRKPSLNSSSFNVDRSISPVSNIRWPSSRTIGMKSPGIYSSPLLGPRSTNVLSNLSHFDAHSKEMPKVSTHSSTPSLYSTWPKHCDTANRDMACDTELVTLKPGVYFRKSGLSSSVRDAKAKCPGNLSLLLKQFEEGKAAEGMRTPPYDPDRRRKSSGSFLPETTGGQLLSPGTKRRINQLKSTYNALNQEETA